MWSLARLRSQRHDRCMNTNWFFALGALWVGGGLVLGWSMKRHGHDLLSWLGLGISLGPIAIPLALDARKRAEDKKAAANAELIHSRQAHERDHVADRHVRAMGAQPHRNREPHDIVVGVDGSENSMCALSEALDVLGDRVRTCMLVAVGDIEALVEENFPGPHPIHLMLSEALLRASTDHPEVDFMTMTRSGRPAEELCTVAEKGEYQLLVIGAQGKGATSALLGSTATEVIRLSTVPVLVGSQHELSRAHAWRDAIEVGAAPLLNAGWPV
jgi:nucleotide-binding universal stress UspA family protein